MLIRLKWRPSESSGAVGLSWGWADVAWADVGWADVGWADKGH